MYTISGANRERITNDTAILICLLS